MTDLIIGIVAIYAWVHSIIIISRKVKDTTKYERVVLIASLIAFVLMFIGVVTES